MQQIIDIDLQSPQSQIWVATLIITAILGITADLVNKTGAMDRIIDQLNEQGYYLTTRPLGNSSGTSSGSRTMWWINLENGLPLQGGQGEPLAPLAITFFDNFRDFESLMAEVRYLKAWYYPLHDYLGGTPNLYASHCQLDPSLVRQWIQSEYWMTISEAWLSNVHQLAGVALNIS